MNTPQKGKFRHIVFKDGDTWYAVALEFNIVESSDDPKVAFMSLMDAVAGYIEACKKLKGARMAPLNQKADSDYEKLWKTITSPKTVKSPFVVDMFGYSRI